MLGFFGIVKGRFMRKRMRPKSRLLLLFIGFASLLSSLPTTLTAAASPHSITTTNASDDYQILISGQTLTELSIEPATDHDYFYIDVNAGQTITVVMVRTSADQALNGLLDLFDPTGAMIASDDNSGHRGNPLIQEVEAITTGRYMLRVRDYSGTRTGTYQITATVAEPLVSGPSFAITDLETDPCPLPMAAITVPEIADPTTGPKNPQFEIGNQALPRTGYPLNCEFARDRQILATAITPTAFTIQNAGQVQTTDAFVVDSSAQYLLFDYMVGRKTADKPTRLHVEVLSGPTFATITDLSQHTIRGQYLDGWKRGVLAVDAFRGQTIKLRFINDSSSAAQPSAQVRAIKLSIEVPDWQPSPVGTTAIEYNDSMGAHAVITGASAFLISAPFTIPLQTQSLSFNYQTGRRLNNASAPIEVQVLNGPDFITATPIDNNTVTGRLSDGWKRATLDIQAFRGQVVKLKIVNDWWPNEPQTTAIDSFKLNRAVPGWEVTNANYVSIESLQIPPSTLTNVLTNTDFEIGFTPIPDIIPNQTFELPSNPLQTLSFSTMSLNGTNVVTTTPPIVVPEQATSLQFEALIGDSSNPSLIKPVTVAILSGDAFDIRELPIDHQIRGTIQTGLQTAVIDIKRYQGKTIKLQFTNHTTNAPTSQLSNFRLVDHVPQWQANSQTRLNLINESSANPTHAFLVGTQSSLLSAPFTLPTEAQQIRFEYRTGHTDNATRQSRIQLTVLSGPDFGIRTRIDQNRLVGTDVIGWQSIAFDLQRFQGMPIKLEWVTELTNQPYLRLDNLQVGVAMTGWQASESSDILIEPTTPTLGQSMRINGNAATITSQPWTVLSNTVSLSFDYKVLRINETGNANLYVDVLSGHNFEVITRIDANGLVGSITTPNNGWQRATLNVSQFQGRTIKLQFKNAGYAMAQSWIDNLTLNHGQPSASHGSDEAPDGSFLTLLNTGTAQSALSSSFVVATDTQFLRFEYQTGTFEHGNEQRSFVVDILSGNNFATITTINQSLPSRSLNDGWQVAKLPISQFQGQTVKLRLTMPFVTKRSVVRIDKLALLSPRAQLTTPIAVDGTTYLNVPLTELGGITTTASMTITALVVYDEYVDLEGIVRYDNASYQLVSTGTTYRSMLGSPNDKVVDSIDQSNTFNLLHFAVRDNLPTTASLQQMAIADPVIALYLQKKNTRQLTAFEFSIDNTLLINELASAMARYDTDYYHDIWFKKIIKPYLIEDIDITDYSANTSNHSELLLKHRVRTKNIACEVIEEVVYAIVFNGDADIEKHQEHDIYSSIEIMYEQSSGKPINPNSNPAICDGYYDLPSSSSIQIGTIYPNPKQTLSVKIATYGTETNGEKADYLTRGRYNGSFYVEKKKYTPQIYLNAAVSLPKVPMLAFLTGNIASTVVSEGREEFVAKNQEKVFKHVFKGIIDLNSFATRSANHSFDYAVLDTAGYDANAFWGIKHWKGGRFSSSAMVSWHIPFTNNIYDAESHFSETNHTIIIYFMSGN